MEIVYGILGQTTVRMHGKMTEEWGSRQARHLLAALLTRPGKRFSPDSLISLGVDRVSSPRQPQDALYKAMTRLRQALEAADHALVIRTVNGGYQLDIRPDLVDIHVFNDEMRRARQLSASGDHENACEVARAALALWRDEPLAGMTSEPARNSRRASSAADWAPAHSFLASELLAADPPRRGAETPDRRSPPVRHRTHVRETPHHRPLRAGAVRRRSPRSLPDGARSAPPDGDAEAAADLQAHHAPGAGATPEPGAKPEVAPRPAPAPRRPDPRRPAPQPPRVPRPCRRAAQARRRPARPRRRARPRGHRVRSARHRRRPRVPLGAPRRGPVPRRHRLRRHAGIRAGPARTTGEVVDLVLTALDYPIDRLGRAPPARAARLRSLL